MTIASRSDPRTLVPAARALYAAGKTRSEVLTSIYGVDLPREAVLIERDFVTGDKPLRVLWNTHPWELMIPLDRGGPKYVIHPDIAAEEALAYAQAPHVLLLGELNYPYPEVPTGFSMFGYDLNEVSKGRSTVVGVLQQRQVPASGLKFTVLGPSLLDVFADAIGAYHASWGDRDGRDASEEKRDAEHEAIAVEAIRHELAANP
jgi:hypothetical protein